MIENADVENFNENITISGGIWDMNHKEQYPNPLHYPIPDLGMLAGEWMRETGFDRGVRQRYGVYLGFCFVLNGVNGLSNSNLTVKNPVTFGIDPNTYITNLSVRHASQTNELDTPAPFLVNKGKIGKLYMSMIDAGDDPVLINEGEIVETIVP